MEIKSTLRRSRKDACLCSRLVKQTNLSTLRLRSIVVVNRIHEKESLDPGSAISNPVLRRQSSFCIETPPHRQHSTAGVRCSYETKQDRTVANPYSPIGVWCAYEPRCRTCLFHPRQVGIQHRLLLDPVAYQYNLRFVRYSLSFNRPCLATYQHSLRPVLCSSRRPSIHALSTL
jgi:hypothetical protein